MWKNFRMWSSATAATRLTWNVSRRHCAAHDIKRRAACWTNRYCKGGPMEERWRAITEYPDYEVSDQGRVRRLTTRTSTRSGKILSVAALRAGYPSVDLCRAGTRKTHLVHRVVAGAFLGPCPPGHE